MSIKENSIKVFGTTNVGRNLKQLLGTYMLVLYYLMVCRSNVDPSYYSNSRLHKQI